MSCDETERSWMNCFRRFGISFIFKVMHSVIGLLDTEDDDETSEMYPSTRRHIPEDLNLSSSTPTRTSNLPKKQTRFHNDPPFFSTQNPARCRQDDRDITSQAGLL